MEKCLLCGGEMKLAATEETSWWQCQSNPTHRMSLTEWSDLNHQKRTKGQIIEAMKEREVDLQRQLDETQLVVAS